jgi:DNA-binding response OmpR family regulator
MSAGSVQSTEEVGGSRSARVLVIEDDPSIAKVLKLCLRAGGFEVAEAHTSEGALQALDAGGVDAVVVDPGLSDGLGRVVLDRLARDTGSAPVSLVVSALSQDDLSRRFGQAAAHFLAKPFDPGDLTKILRQLLAAGESQPKEGIHA